VTTRGGLLYAVAIFEVTIQVGGPASVSHPAARVAKVVLVDTHKGAPVHLPGAVVLGHEVVVRRALLVARRNGSPGAPGRGVPRGLRRQWKTVRRFRRRGTAGGNIAARQEGYRWLERGCKNGGGVG